MRMTSHNRLNDSLRRRIVGRLEAGQCPVKTVFGVGIRLSSSENEAADCEISVVTTDEPKTAVIWPKLL
ncbi:hypothetical protein TNCV_4233831 [Trichonephila clavipes]|nr:hypothetical protein TNCV_4233831 [Trichonephila clavipes]